MKLKITLIGLIVVLLQGCAVGQRTVLSQADRGSIKSVDLYNLVIQDEVRPAVDISNVAGAMGGGLIPALIDSSINKGRSLSAQDVAEPLFFATDSVDFRKMLAKEINTSVTSLYTLRSQKDVAETKLLSDPDLIAKIKQLNEGENLLYTSSFYNLMENSKSIKVETVAFVFKKSAAAKSGKPKPIYFNRLAYISESVGNGGADSIAAWAKNNGELFVKILSDGAAEIAQVLKYDLQNSVQFECNKLVAADIFGLNGAKFNIKSILVEQKPTRAVVRNSADGALYSVPGTPVPSKKLNKKCKQ